MPRYRVTLHEDKGDKFQLVFDCTAEDEDDAAYKAENVYPNGEIVHIMEIENEPDRA